MKKARLTEEQIIGILQEHVRPMWSMAWSAPIPAKSTGCRRVRSILGRRSITGSRFPRRSSWRSWRMRPPSWGALGRPDARHGGDARASSKKDKPCICGMHRFDLRPREGGDQRWPNPKCWPTRSWRQWSKTA